MGRTPNHSLGGMGGNKVQRFLPAFKGGRKMLFLLCFGSFTKRQKNCSFLASFFFTNFYSYTVKFIFWGGPGRYHINFLPEWEWIFLLVRGDSPSFPLPWPCMRSVEQKLWSLVFWTIKKHQGEIRVILVLQKGAKKGVCSLWFTWAGRKHPQGPVLVNGYTILPLLVSM